MPKELPARNRFSMAAAMSASSLRLGTRASPLAKAQTALTIQALANHYSHLTIEVIEIHTSGDKDTIKPLSEIGGKALFTKELDEALLDGRIDVAVHSLKDVPADYPRALAFAAVLPREDVHDVLIARDPKIHCIKDLPAGALLGTSSPRRAIQAQLLNPLIRVAPIRGNVATRLRKIEDGLFDATMLARAGLNRLGIEQTGHVVPAAQMIPAVGQGVIALQCRTDDTDVLELMQAVHHMPTWHAVQAERGLLETLGGTCRSAIAAYAQLEGNDITLHGFVARYDGSAHDIQIRQGTTEQARKLGEDLGRYYIDRYGHDFYR